MIDWPSIVLNTFWILGSATILAAVGYYYCQSKGVWRRMWRDAAFQSIFAAGVGLCAVGIAAGSGTWWLQGLWGALALLAFGQGWQASRSWRKAK
jgi:hypothetical protein